MDSGGGDEGYRGGGGEEGITDARDCDNFLFYFRKFTQIENKLDHFYYHCGIWKIYIKFGKSGLIIIVDDLTQITSFSMSHNVCCQAGQCH
jgi:hypothetical protein